MMRSMPLKMSIKERLLEKKMEPYFARIQKEWDWAPKTVFFIGGHVYTSVKSSAKTDIGRLIYKLRFSKFPKYSKV